MNDSSRLTSYRQIIIRDLILPVSIGIFPEERRAPQRVKINLRIYLPEPGPFVGASIEDTLSYATIVEGIHTLIGKGHIDLVERFVEAIAGLCFEDVRVCRVQVEVLKMDVIPEAAGVGVAIDRWRTGH